MQQNHDKIQQINTLGSINDPQGNAFETTNSEHNPQATAQKSKGRLIGQIVAWWVATVPVAALVSYIIAKSLL